MKTIPDGTFKEHLERLIAFLLNNGVNIGNREILFYDNAKTKRNEMGERLDASNLMDADRAKILFHCLCKQGKEWIKLTAMGIWHKYYLISIDYAGGVVRHSVTAMNFEHPSDLASKLQKNTTVNIVGDIKR